MGVAFGDPANPATMTVDFAGTRVFSGTIPTRSGPVAKVQWDQHDILASWDTTVNLGDTAAVSISVSNATVLISNLVMNNRSDRLLSSIKSGVTWPAHQPADIDELLSDATDLEYSEFELKYGFPLAQLNNFVQSTVAIPASENYIPFPRQSHTDFKINDRLLPTVGPAKYKDIKGVQHYTLASGDTLHYNLLLANTTV